MPQSRLPPKPCSITASALTQPPPRVQDSKDGNFRTFSPSVTGFNPRVAAGVSQAEGRHRPNQDLPPQRVVKHRVHPAATPRKEEKGGGEGEGELQCKSAGDGLLATVCQPLSKRCGTRKHHSSMLSGRNASLFVRVSRVQKKDYGCHLAALSTKCVGWIAACSLSCRPSLP